MPFSIWNFALAILPLVYGTSESEGKTSVISDNRPMNELGLRFGHTRNERENYVDIYFDVANFTLHEYRYYYYDFRPFGTIGHSEFMPRRLLIDAHNSLRIYGLHENDYVACVSFVDEYEKAFKPRFACYEFTVGEKIVGSHHGGSSGYLAPLLLAIAFVLHVFIAIVHHIKEKNYATKLLHRFIDVSSKSNRKRQMAVKTSLKEFDKDLDHPHISASVQRRLSRVAIDADENNNHLTNGGSGFLSSEDELPLYVLPHHHHSRRVSTATMPPILEHEHNNQPMDSISSIRHLIDSVPWKRRASRISIPRLSHHHMHV